MPRRIHGEPGLGGVGGFGGAIRGCWQQIVMRTWPEQVARAETPINSGYGSRNGFRREAT